MRISSISERWIFQVNDLYLFFFWSFISVLGYFGSNDVAESACHINSFLINLVSFRPRYILAFQYLNPLES